MSKFSEYIKSLKEKDMQFFFKGGYNKVSNQYFRFNHVINDEEIIISTNNIRVWKDNYVLIIGNNKVVYLKYWQVRQVKSWDLGENSYLVKLNKNYFRPYETKFEIEDVCFEKEDTFETLKAVAMQQDKTNLKWAFGQL